MSKLTRAASAALELQNSSSSAFRSCCRPAATSTRSFVPVARARPYSFGASIPNSPGAGPSRPSRRRYYLFALPLALLPFTLFRSSRKPLDPLRYSDHELGTSTRLTAQHAQLAIPLNETDAALFRRPPSTESEGKDEDEGGTVSIQHVMIKNPDLQIERPYTPINDVGKDGQIELVVKRVKGGEVGRMIHGLQPGATVGVRGPLNTLSFRPGDYDRIVMISTGTGVAPFLQLLRKLPTGSSTPPEMHLIHSAARDPALDFLETPALLPHNRDTLRIDRPPPGPIPTPMLEQALSARKEGKKVLVLVCLPQNLMRPLCGGLTIDMKQGPITGTLGQMGLTNAEVYKLE